MEIIIGDQWMSWCRLCAKPEGSNNKVAEPVSSLPNSDISTSIEDLLQTQLNNAGKLPKQVCEQCQQELIAALRFRNRAVKVLQMYDFLINSDAAHNFNLKTLLEKFGLFDYLPKCEKQSAERLWLSAGPFQQQPSSIQQDDESIKMELELDIALSEGEKSNESDAFMCDEVYFKASSKSIEELSRKSKKVKRIPRKPNKRISTASKSKTPEAKYSCKTCLKIFKRKTNFIAHMRLVHGEDTTVQAKLISDNCLNDQPQSFICRYCDQKFENKFMLQHHFKSDHEDIIKQTFVCEICGATFPKKGQLKEHILIHTDEAPFKCTICGLGFKLPNRLKRHMEVHEGKHNCNICGKQLSSRTTLNSHLLVHSDAMPHKCDYCGRAFKRAKTLKAHLLAHTGLRPFVCNFCDKAFSNGSCCRAHKKQIHPKELAAMDEEGKKSYTKNLPKLEALKAIVKTGENIKPLQRRD